MLMLGSGCKHTLTLTESFGCTETIPELYQNSTNEHQVPIKLHLVADFTVAGKLMYFSCTAESGGRVYTGV